MAQSHHRAVLMLADGTRFDGFSIGAQGETGGEVVFNTSMTGYQEILTDPSYAGQIMTLTYPLIGNYGVNDADTQSGRIQTAGLIIREMSGLVSNHYSEQSLQDYLAEAGVVGIEGIDTRALVLKLRTAGAMNGIISSVDFDDASLQAKAQAVPSMQGLDLATTVTCEAPYVFEPREQYPKSKAKPLKVVAYDFGIKRNILELMAAQNFEVTVVPASTSAEDVLAMEPDGVFCSNGPGDPEPVTYAVENLRKLIGKKPLFGICLGHQLLGLALGAKSFKLKFGHRGGNHPVRDELTNKVEISAQNHGFCIDHTTLPEGVKITHWNLNDDTLEGFEHTEYPLFAVQYHPEAAPGPHDSSYLFPRFREMMEKHRLAS